MGDFIAEVILGAIQAVVEWVVRLIYGIIERLVCLVWRSLSPSKRDRREQKLGLHLVYGDDRRLADVVLLIGVHAGRKISELPLDIVMSLQSTWPRLVGRAAIARWLDRNSRGWRRNLPRRSSSTLDSAPPRAG